MISFKNSIITYVLGALKKRLPVTFLLRSQNLCLIEKKMIIIIFRGYIFFYYTSREFPIQNFHRRTTDIL